MNNKIGVYICHCGSNISDVIDVKKVRDEISRIPEVTLAKTVMFACADSSQKEIIEDIKNNQLDGLVVASCSPKLHLYTFRSVAERAGLNYHQYVQVNIREQDSWAHSDNPADATEKAIKLITSGIARAKLAESLTPVKIAAKDSVLVVGAGVAGMRAAIELADMGMYVYLIEKEHFTGGRVSREDTVFTTEQNGSEITGNLFGEVKRREEIQLFTGAEIVEKSGSVGDFQITVRIRPRYFKSDVDPVEFDRVAGCCPVEVPDPLTYELTSRKAVYNGGPDAFPKVPAIDREICKEGCSECLNHSDAIDIDATIEDLKINCGAILLCTGFDDYDPAPGEYGYGEIENVITLSRLRKLVELSNGSLKYHGREIKNIAYIYCVGSRQNEGENKYCSKYCCTAAIHTAILVKTRFPEINNFHFNRGIRTYGKHESYYHKSNSFGDAYLQFNEDNPVSISEDEKGNTVVRLKDILTAGQELELDADLVVLVTGMVPRKDQSVADILKVPRGRDRFYNEVHPKLRPVETVMDGIYIAGTCQGPKTISESIKSSLTAASKIYTLLGRQKLSLEPTQAKVNNDDCTWCEKCSDACPFDAIEKIRDETKFIASVNPALCKGCGMCLPVCETNALDLVGFSDIEMENMIEALAE